MMKRLFFTWALALFAWVLQAQTSVNTVRYRLTYSASTTQYTVWVIPNYSTPNANNPLVNEFGATAQVTLKVPSSFVIEGITDVNGIWEKDPLKLGPAQQSFFQGQGLDPLRSYYVIGKSASETNYGPFANGTAIPLFRFRSNACLGIVQVIDPTDPFVSVADQVLALNTAPSFYSRSGQPSGGNQTPLEQYIGQDGPGANCISASVDSFTGSPGTPVNQSVLANDTFSGIAPTLTQVTLTVVTPPTNGTTTVNSDGTIRYTPNPGFEGTDTYTYQICDIANPTVCSTATVSVTVTCPAVPIPSVTTPITYCQQAVAVPLTAVPQAGTTLRWYTVPTGGTFSTTAPTPATNVATTLTFYVSNVIALSGCESARVPIQVIIQPAPAAPAPVSPIVYCQNQVAVPLAAVAPSGTTLRWYTVPTGGVGSATPMTPVTSTVGVITFFVTSVSSTTSCESLTRTPVQVNVVALPSSPSVSSPIAFCQNEVASALTATAPSGSTLLWYDQLTGGVGSTQAPVPPTNVVGQRTYYVSSVSSTTGCESAVRTALVVNVNATPAIPSATTFVLYCQGDVASALTASAPSGATLRWYMVPTGGAVLPSAPTPSTAVAGDQLFYVSSFSSSTGCESGRTSITVRVNTAPTAPTASSPVVYCLNDSAVPLQATGPVGTSLRWYTQQTGGTFQSTAPTPSTATSGTTTFFVSSFNATTGCESITRTLIQVTVGNRPVAPSAASSVAYCQGESSTALVATAPVGASVRWYTTPTGGTPLASAPVPSTSVIGSTFFYASSILNTSSCESTTRTAIQVVVSGAPMAPTASPVSACQGSPSTPLTATAPSGATLRWYATASGGTALPTAPSPSTAALGQTTFYVSSVSNSSSCESLTRTPVTFNVVVCRIIYAFNDNNITPVNTPVTGSVVTNDDINNGIGALVVSTTLVSNPTNGSAVMSANGTYTYTPSPNYTGNDTFRYRVCDQGSPAVCDTALVTINIHAQPRINVNNPPISLNDVFSTNRNIPISGTVLANDRDPDAGQILTTSLLTNPNSGSVQLNSNGTFTYTPVANFVGEVTFTYRACDNGSPVLCDDAAVQIVVKDPTLTPQAPPVAGDDFVTTPSGVPVSGNVLNNDRDPEGTTLVISTTPVVSPTNGTVVISQNGSFSYSPNSGFTGTDSFVYRVCDSGTPIECTNATVYLQVTVGSIRLLPRVYLQGALYNVFLPDSLMRDDLRVRGLLPLSSPYPSLGLPEVTPTTATTSSVLAVTGRNAIVDWVYLELRDQNNPLQVLDSRSALLQRDGDVVEVDGVSAVTFRAVQPSSYYVVVRHRNHLGVMTQNPVPLTSLQTVVDFRRLSTPTYRLSQTIVDQAQVVVQQGVALWAGNVFRDGRVVYQGTGNDVNSIYQLTFAAPANILQSPIFKLRTYNLGDINMNGETVSQGTANDVEFIYINVFGNHPGNVLGQNFFIIREQLP